MRRVKLNKIERVRLLTDEDKQRLARLNRFRRRLKHDQPIPAGRTFQLFCAGLRRVYGANHERG